MANPDRCGALGGCCRNETQGGVDDSDNNNKQKQAKRQGQRASQAVPFEGRSAQHSHAGLLRVQRHKRPQEATRGQQNGVGGLRAPTRPAGVVTVWRWHWSSDLDPGRHSRAEWEQRPYSQPMYFWPAATPPPAETPPAGTQQKTSKPALLLTCSSPSSPLPSPPSTRCTRSPSHCAACTCSTSNDLHWS